MPCLKTITDRLSIASSSGGYEPELITEWAEAFSRRTVGVPLTGAAMPASRSACGAATRCRGRSN
jgi:hypothetical protein